MNGCELMKCTDYKNGVCQLEGGCKFRDDFSDNLDELVGGISVLQEAVEKLLASDPQIAGTTDEELEDAMQNGYDPQIRIQAEAILIARNALRMTGSLNPSNENGDSCWK